MKAGSIKLSLKIFWVNCFLIISLQLNAQLPTAETCDKMIDRGIELIFNKEHTQSLELLIKAKAIAEENGWKNQNFRAINNIGANYYMMEDYGEALKNYLEAYQIALQSANSKQEMAVFNNIGILYFQEKNLSKAKEYFINAYSTAKKIDDPVKLGYYAINLALVNNKMDEWEEASRYIEEATPLTDKDSDEMIKLRLALAENLLIRKKYRESEQVSFELLPRLEGKAQQENKLFLLLVIARIYEQTGFEEKAIEYAKQARLLEGGIENKIDVLQYLAKLYAKYNYFDTAISYKDSVIAAKDSLHKKRNSKLFENGKIKFELQNYQIRLDESRETLSRERKIFYSYTGISIVFIIFIIWIFRSSLVRQKQRKKIAELELEKEKNQSLIIQKQLRENEALAALEQEKLKNELEQKNRKLAVKAVHLSARNELIEDVINSLSSQSEVARNRELKESIQGLKDHLKKDHQWDHFFTHFEEINQGFINRLNSKHPNLTSSDLRFITYLYMNLNNKEISSLLNITPESCRKRKERLCKKLNIDKNENIYSYLLSV